tara:strand:- start:1196 stop:2500 length:1305 start_codon:yes stop_codon:yes gene_type:complete
MKITNREKEIIQLVADELTTKEIAAQLYISNETVTTHRQNLMEKLDVKNAAGLVRRGFESGLLKLAMAVMIFFQFYNVTVAQALPIALETDTSHAVRFGVPIDQTGNKLYWEPKKSALLVGTGSFLFARTWDLDEVGNFATTFGSLNRPNGDHSMSWGQANAVDVDFGTAWGKNNRAGGYASTVIGEGNISKGYGSLVVGVYNDTIQGMADQGIFSGNTPLLIVGNGTNDTTRSNAFAVYGNGFVKVGSGGAAEADLHVVQSENLYEGGTSGILLESKSQNGLFQTTALWKIQAHTQLLLKSLNFNLNGQRVSQIDYEGNYIKIDDFAPQNNPINKSIKSASNQISNMRIGNRTISKNKGKVTLNRSQFLKDFPNMVIYDENEEPFAIDYKQLYLTAIVALQEEIKTNDQQQKEINELKSTLAEMLTTLKNKNQ